MHAKDKNLYCFFSVFDLLQPLNDVDNKPSCRTHIVKVLAGKYVVSYIQIGFVFPAITAILKHIWSNPSNIRFQNHSRYVESSK
jgi:hypothetical protein